MILSNEVVVRATPHEVFRLVNDVERVVTCLPGASVDGRDGDGYSGGVKVKVGPVSAAYTGSVRFTEVDHDALRMRLQARGTDTRGSGDAEAQVDVTIHENPAGALLRLETDLVIRGKIAQFGKGAIKAVSDRLLQQFAVNLGALLDQDRAPAPQGTAGAAVTAPVPAPAAAGELDGMALLMGPGAAKYAPLAGAFLCGLVQGWLLAKVSSQSRQLKELRRG
ncbi:SRPBCC family protein [Streptomyces sp. NPDC054834]